MISNLVIYCYRNQTKEFITIDSLGGFDKMYVSKCSIANGSVTPVSLHASNIFVDYVCDGKPVQRISLMSIFMEMTSHNLKPEDFLSLLKEN